MVQSTNGLFPGAVGPLLYCHAEEETKARTPCAKSKPRAMCTGDGCPRRSIGEAARAAKLLPETIGAAYPNAELLPQWQEWTLLFWAQFKWNLGTTGQYKEFSITLNHLAVQWGRDTIQVKAPAFKYVGHYLAHLAYQAGVHADILSRAQADVACFGHLPLNSFERAQLLNSVLIPQWVYHSLLVPDDRLFHQLDKVGKSFVLTVRGMDKIHNTSHITAPKNAGGMGPHQVYWAYRVRYITVMQDILRRPNLVRHMGEHPVPHNVITLRNYMHALQQLRAYTLEKISHKQAQPRGGLGLFDEESEDDAIFWKAKEKVVGREEYTRKYVCPDATQHTPEDGQIPPSFVPCTINGIPCYHNQKQRKGTTWHSDGSKLRDNHTGAPRAGAAATCGPLQIINRVMGPQDSYRAELQGSVMVTTHARPGDSLTLDNKRCWTPGPPTHDKTRRESARGGGIRGDEQ